MDKPLLLFASLFTSFFICLGVFGFAVGVTPVVDAVSSVADWVEQHPYLTGLLASEILGVLPVKANGLLHATGLGGNKLLSFIKNKFFIHFKSFHHEN